MRNRKRHELPGFAVTLAVSGALLGLGLLVAGCDFGGYNNLGSKLDLLEPLSTEDASSWMRTLSDGDTEFLTLGGADESGAGSFAFVRVRRDASATIYTGDYLADDETIAFTSTIRFDMPDESSKAPAMRTGSRRTQLDPPETDVYDLEVEDDTLSISDGFFKNTFTELHSVIGRLDLSTVDGITALARFYNLTVITVQTRIPDYGGAGMIQYAQNTGEFTGILAGSATLELSSVLSPRSTLTFSETIDFLGITLDGAFVSDTNFDGDGDLTGTVAFAVEDPAASGGPPITGAVEYRIDLGGGVASGGTYEVTVDGQGTTSLPFEVLEDMDFRDVLAP